LAITGNPFDDSGLDPARYVNFQASGYAEVVHPPPGVTSDQFLCYFSEPNRRITYITHAKLVAAKRLSTISPMSPLPPGLPILNSRPSPGPAPLLLHRVRTVPRRDLFRASPPGSAHNALASALADVSRLATKDPLVPKPAPLRRPAPSRGCAGHNATRAEATARR
jgi:hypothetical protein